MSKMSELHAEMQKLAAEVGIDGLADMMELCEMEDRLLAMWGCGCEQHTHDAVELVTGFACEEYGFDKPDELRGYLWLHALRTHLEVTYH